MGRKVKFEFARTGIIAFIIVGLLGFLVPYDRRLWVFGPVALTLLLGLMLGKYRKLPFGKSRDVRPVDNNHNNNPQDHIPPAQA